MKAVVTGGAGMVGIQLVRILHQKGYDVTVLDNLSRGHNIDASLATYVTGDATDLDTCLQVFEGADYIFNLAAEVAGVRFNQNNHSMMYGQNVRLTYTPLEAAKIQKVGRFLQVSSVCVYAPEYNHPCLEMNGHKGEPTPANAGYSWAKRRGETMVLESGIPCVIVRPSNMYGPYDYFDERGHVIPNLIRQVFNGPHIDIFGKEDETIREFLHTQDAASAMSFLIEFGENGQVYNVGTNGETKISLASLIEMVESIVGIRRGRRLVVNGGDTGDQARWSDCNKIEGLGWRYQIGLEEGLREVVDWYASLHSDQ